MKEDMTEDEEKNFSAELTRLSKLPPLNCKRCGEVPHLFTFYTIKYK